MTARVRLTLVLTVEGQEFASESSTYDAAGVTLHEPVIYKSRGSSDYTTIGGLVARTIPWTQIKHADLATGKV